MRSMLFVVILTMFYLGQCFAFKPSIHGDITEDSLSANGFSNEAISIIKDINGEVDLHQLSPSLHADDNKLGDASQLLKDKVEYIVDSLVSQCDGQNARANLGEALHTLQDIYSHTNAVDDGLLPLLAGENILSLSNGSYINTPCKKVLIDGRYHFTQGSPDSRGGLVTGWFPITITESGQCSHGELNKDNPGNLVPHTEAVNAAKIGTDTYLEIINSRLLDASGNEDDFAFYKRIFKNEQPKTIYVIDTTGSMEDDLVTIKRDLNTFIESHLNTNTKVPRLGLVTFKDNESDSYSTGFICIIRDFKPEVDNLIAYGGDDCPEASYETALRALQFFPPSTPPNIEGLTPDGKLVLHTDAPPRNPGLFLPLLARAKNKRVNVIVHKTKGCELDSTKQNVYTKAHNQSNILKKEPNNDLVLDGMNNPNTRSLSYQALSEETGGIYFNTSKADLEYVMPITLFMSEPDVQTVFNQRVLVENNLVKELIVNVDSSMINGNIMFLIKTTDDLSLPIVKLTRPDGNIVLETDSNVSLVNLNSIMYYQVNAPMLGEWKIELSNGVSSYLVRVLSKSDFKVSNFRFLKSVGESREGGVIFEPLQGNPTYNEEITVKFEMTNSADDLQLQLLNINGDILSNLLLQEGNAKSYITSFNTPIEPFQLKILGMFNSSQFQRVIPRIITPVSVKINLERSIEKISNIIKGVQSEIKTIDIYLTNTDNNSATYILNSYSQMNYPLTIQNQITVPAGQTQAVPVSITIPADAIVGSIDEIMIIAEDINNANNSNYKVANLVIKSDALFTNDFE